jgi:hypothetical protein
MEAKKKKDSEPQKAAESEGAKALKVFRIDDVSASIFVRQRNVRGEDRQFYSVTFSRSYKDSQGQWRYTKWFDLDDLGKIVTVAQQAGEYIHGRLEQTA